MEQFLDTILVLMLLACFTLTAVLGFIFLKNSKLQHEFQKELVRSIIDQTERYEEAFRYTRNQIDEVTKSFDRSLVALRDSLEPTKPMKPNNWGSMREAFKLPTKVSVDE